MTTRVILKPGDAVPWTWSVQPTPSDPISTDSERFDHRKLKSTFSTTGMEELKNNWQSSLPCCSFSLYIYFTARIAIVGMKVVSIEY